ncbi:disulfide oxidoreductase [Candidatus Pacearchaeota archaeon CG09_land_8_20_14_0_10_30_9]|nr:MAG: hypothetical protein QJ16_C0010G0005 [archaeon GW2011_AR1]MBS3078009.1 DUF1858 domain-containing protein [Candidatus Pacearchaeota archaeon]OIO40307.1 MAG: disulfide oxidoreductase [Candidatus Pacearchaeota archaeon CG1_02_30_18]PIN71196.1 MAG: disulfide oxidoreductase [Candidatus Pacearchaeota archaeon CG11_big_fil_rev_8_21_14_0_20_30_13]PIO01447.1 MAG: disulfide oxidoreductase [Candidatus Pacearchaeota archaeon CG09_land_8_20_14_0_10_30_9]PIZ82315.1 MAG: disulfide oxidoreductase [Can
MKKELINKKMSILEIIDKKPDAIEILLEFGLGCVGCAFSEVENLEQGALSHGMTKKEIDQLVEEINKL